MLFRTAFSKFTSSKILVFISERLMSAPCRALCIFFVMLKKSGLPWITRHSAFMPRLFIDDSECLKCFCFPEDAINHLEPDEGLVIFDTNQPITQLYSVRTGIRPDAAGRTNLVIAFAYYLAAGLGHPGPAS